MAVDKVNLSAVNLGLIPDSEKKLIECFYGRSTVNAKRQPVNLEKIKFLLQRVMYRTKLLHGKMRGRGMSQ